MNSFQKLAYEIQRGQQLREKLSNYTEKRRASLNRLRDLVDEGKATPRQIAQFKWLDNLRTSNMVGNIAAREIKTYNQFLDSGHRYLVPYEGAPHVLSRADVKTELRADYGPKAHIAQGRKYKESARSRAAELLQDKHLLKKLRLR